MTIIEEKVKSICNEVYTKDFQQITIDLIQDQIEDLLTSDEKPTSEYVGAACYSVGILVESINPKHTKDFELLSRLYKALHGWLEEIDNVDKILNII